ncbi:HEC/Ndc80p family-domain-containing protein [Zopfochytrium polystomum]|nr:HEC/Ndc80p family-domain-containing protein [Zopfochytrium polystomum]
MSDARVSMTGRRLSTMTSRSSAFTGRPSNVGVSTFTNAPVITKDPRPIRDKSWQSASIRKLIQFLVEKGYNNPVSPKLLQAPSQKDFQTIFKFLYKLLDPMFPFESRFEEEVPLLLKGLKYPFCDQISKSHLQAVGTMHAWPGLLAMLIWLVDLIVACERMDQFVDFAESPEIKAEQEFYRYLTKAYARFLAGEDDYTDMDDKMKASFDAKNREIIKETDQIRAEIQILEKERDLLANTESPLIIAKKERAIIQSDIEKFTYYNSHLEKKKKKLEEETKALSEELEVAERELETKLQEKAELQKVVDAQQISQADVDRMNAEKDQFVATRKKLAESTDAQRQEMWRKETQLQKMMQELEDKLNLNGQTVDEIVSIDLQSNVKPMLLQLRDKQKALVHKHQEESVAIQEQVDRVNERIQEMTESIELTVRRTQQLNDQYKEDKEVLSRLMASTRDEIEQIEQDIQRMRSDSEAELAFAKEKAVKKQMEFDQAFHRLMEARNRASKAASRALEDMITFRERVTDTLNDLEESYAHTLKETKALKVIGDVS